MNRPSWSTYFLNLAQVVSTRATCPRKSVGAILVRDNRVLATGFNGVPTGENHCNHEENAETVFIGDFRHCARAIHAEANVILQCATFGIPTQGATIYITESPCDYCLRLIKGSGIIEIVVS